MIVVGNGFTQNRMSSFVDKMHDELLSFRDYYTDSLVFSKAMEKMFTSIDDLHGGGFSCLGTIFAAFYGRFFQPFQYALGLRRVQDGNITKSYQHGYDLVQMVANELFRYLHTMH